MIYGFSGTERGMTSRQWNTVRYLFHELKLMHLHHGDCIGADEQAHKLAKNLLRGGSAKVTIHPPDNPRLRAFCKDYDEIRPELPYLSRNSNIARDGVDGLIVTPLEFAEVIRSGTWATIRYARKLKRPIWLVLPDGTFHQEGCLRVQEDSSRQMNFLVD